MVKSNVVELAGRDTIYDPLTELLRAGAEHLHEIWGEGWPTGLTLE